MLDGAARITRDMESYVAGTRGKVRVLASVSAMTESHGRRCRGVSPHAGASDDASRSGGNGSARRSYAECAKDWRRWACAGMLSTSARCSHCPIAATISVSSYRKTDVLGQRKRLRFEDTLAFEQVGCGHQRRPTVASTRCRGTRSHVGKPHRRQQFRSRSARRVGGPRHQPCAQRSSDGKTRLTRCASFRWRSHGRSADSSFAFAMPLRASRPLRSCWLSTWLPEPADWAHPRRGARRPR